MYKGGFELARYFSVLHTIGAFCVSHFPSTIEYFVVADQQLCLVFLGLERGLERLAY